MPAAASAPPTDPAYERHKAKAAERQRTISAAGREIGEIPPCADPVRRAAAEVSTEAFALTYFGEKFYLKIAKLQRDYLERLDRCIERGEMIFDAMPRGSGKTTLARISTIRAVLTGRSSYGLLVGSTADDSLQNMDSMRMALTTNALLIADYPEACYPLIALKQTPQRANGQLCQGQHTYVRFRKGVIVLATLPGSRCSGAILQVATMGGAIRGKNFDHPSGRNVRPDLVFLDDPQTKKSARSDLQCKNRESIINGDVKGLRGPGKKLSIIGVGTVIRENDLVDRFLDQEKNPAWHGRRIPMFISRPTDLKLWDRYREIRAESLRRDEDQTEANEFYIANREAMDAGAEVTWPDRTDPGDISGIQFAMNQLFDMGEEEFAAEYQNDPIRHQGSDRPDLKPILIESKIATNSKYSEGVIPLNCDKLVAFIDVQDRLLFYMILAVGPGFNGHVIKYGSWPDQDTRYYTARDARRTLKLIHQGAGIEGAIYAGIHKLADYLHNTQFEREDGVPFSVSPFVLVDEGDNGTTVQRAVREYQHKGFLMTAKGMGLGPADTPLREQKQKEGETIGQFWLCRPLKNIRGQRRVLVDTNEAKTFAAARLETAKGDSGAITVYHATPTHHQLLIDHWCAENRTLQSAKGRDKETWKNDNRKENHFWDCYVGCVVAASTTGLKLKTIVTTDAQPKPKPKKPPRNRVKSLF